MMNILKMQYNTTFIRVGKIGIYFLPFIVPESFGNFLEFPESFASLVILVNFLSLELLNLRHKDKLKSKNEFFRMGFQY